MAGRVVPMLVVLAATSGCRDRVEPVGSFVEDLGDESRPLPPVAVRSYSDDLSGAAELRPLGRPGEEGADAAADPAAAVAAAIQTLVDTYNEIVTDKAWDDLPGYFVDGQQETVTQLAELQKHVIAKLEELRAAVESHAPDAMDKVTALTAAAAAFPQITVSKLEVLGDGKAAGSWAPAAGGPVPLGQNEIRFELVDSEWFIDWPVLQSAAGLMPAIDAALAGFDALIQGINSGQLDAATVATQIETIIAALSQAPNAPKDEAGEAQPEEPPAEEEEQGPPPGPGG
ncbi:MAG: hypothetical protein C4547_11945 [Phycisphaerales bacterium]|nr:MAG: hypothetical protein C4547_11945 [Phycisphaerales bacterium]